MGKRGRPPKQKDVEQQEVESNDDTTQGVSVETFNVVAVPVRSDDIKENGKEPAEVVPEVVALEPLGPGQKYFESPDGDIVIGEADKDRIWHRKLNNGKGGWINPKR